MKKSTLRWAAAAVITWISLDLYFGRKQHEKQSGDFRPPESSSGEAAFFRNGTKLYEHMMERLRGAEHNIYMYKYFFRDDRLGSEIIQVLTQKAQEGVHVRLLVDWIASEVRGETKKKLKNAGVEFAYSQKPSFPFFFYSLNERNHRKVTVIDGEHAYMGGFNVGDEYAGDDPEIGIWRDYHLHIRGPAVQMLGHQFARDWKTATGETISLQKPKYEPENPMPMYLLSTDGAHLPQHFRSLFQRAEHSVFIGTPYYVPDGEMHNEVVRLAQRGVRVRLLFPKYPDHILVKDAAFSYLRELLEAGVEVRQFNQGFYHAKVIMIDEKVVDIGTANFDMRSFYMNHEVNLMIESSEWVPRVTEYMVDDFETFGEPITLEDLNGRTWVDKLRERIAMVFSSWL
ncbi:cardiolipin synthase [Alkalicoccus urumqiensis]|nr:cardiolipin synthase [Alkalicoccus urumqiensis]